MEYAASVLEKHDEEVHQDSTKKTDAKKSPPFDPNHFYFTSTTEEWSRALDEIAKRHKGLPSLPDEAFDREWLYETDEEIIEHKAKPK